jgi:hypothetical protein
MRFMTMVKADKNYEAGAPPDPRLMEAIGKLSEEMMKAGVLVSSEGLLPSSKGARIRASGGKLSVTDGPFSEAKELIGGLAILQVKSKDEAIELARRFMTVHQDVLGPGWEGEIEIRQLFDPADFAAPAG